MQSVAMTWYCTVTRETRVLLHLQKSLWQEGTMGINIRRSFLLFSFLVQHHLTFSTSMPYQFIIHRYSILNYSIRIIFRSTVAPSIPNGWTERLVQQLVV